MKRIALISLALILAIFILIEIYASSRSRPLSYPFEDRNMFFGLTQLKSNSDLEDATHLNVSWVSMQPIVVWCLIEKEPGKYDWNMLDSTVKKIQRINLDCCPVLYPITIPEERKDEVLNMIKDEGATAFLRSNLAAELKLYPHDESLKKWKKFVKALAERYDGDGIKDMPGLRFPIRYWHLLEEYPETWLGPDIDLVYLSILKATREGLTSADPEAKIVLMGLAGNYARFFAYIDGYIKDEDAGVWMGVKYTRSQISENPKVKKLKQMYEHILAAGKEYFDIVDIHLYEEKITFTPGKIKWLLSKMKEYKYTKPVWCIEGGGPFKIPAGTSPKHGDPYFGYYTDKENSEHVIKIHVIAAALGIERMHWALKGTPKDSYWDGPWWVMALKSSEGARKPSYYTFKLLVEKLQGFTEVSNLSSENLQLYMFKTPKGTVYIAWSNNIGTYNLTNIFGNTSLKLTKIFTEKQSDYNVNETIANAYNIKLSETPVFIEP